MKTSEFLKIVKREYLAKSYKEYRTGGNKNRFLCLALACAGDSLGETRISNKLMVRVEKALGDSHTVEAWLVKNKYARFADINRGNVMYSYRHRWIDSLIEEYEAKGD